MVNKVILVGNVGADPEVRHLESGTSVARIRLATNETYKNKDGQKVTNTEWHNIVCWRWLADIAEQYVKKGTQLYVEGKLTTRSWDDKDGVTRYTTEIVADNFQMIGKKGDENTEDYKHPVNKDESSASQTNKASVQEDAPDDDLPF